MLGKRATIDGAVSDAEAVGSELSRAAAVRSIMSSDWDSVSASCALLPAVRLLLRLRGLQATASWLAIRSDVASRPPDTDRCSSVAKAVSMVSNRRLIGATCLPRSLTTWFLLRRRGIDAVVVLGADVSNTDGLPAHAWVEVEGVPLNEAADIRERFGSFGLELPHLTRSQV